MKNEEWCCYLKNISLINDVLNKTLNLPREALFTFYSFTLTTGALVRDIFTKCLLYTGGVEDDNLIINKAVFWKLGVFKFQDHDKFLKLFNDLYYSFNKGNKPITKTLVLKRFLNNYHNLYRKYAYQEIGDKFGSSDCFTTLTGGLFFVVNLINLKNISI